MRKIYTYIVLLSALVQKGLCVTVSPPASPHIPVFVGSAASGISSRDEIGQFFTIDPRIFYNWIDGIGLPKITQVDDIKPYIDAINIALFDGNLFTILEKWSSKFGTVLHGPNHMGPAVSRALIMLSIMGETGRLNGRNFQIEFGFGKKILRPIQVREAHALTFKMLIVRQDDLVQFLRVIAEEEDLSDADFFNFIEVIGRIGAVERMKWFAKLFNPNYAL